MSRVIPTTAMFVQVGDLIDVYEGQPGKGQWRSGLVAAKATQSGPGGGVTLLWLDDADPADIKAAVMVRAGKDVRVVATAQERELEVVKAELTDALARIDWLTGCEDGCDCENQVRPIEDVVVAGGRL